MSRFSGKTKLGMVLLPFYARLESIYDFEKSRQIQLLFGVYMFQHSQNVTAHSSKLEHSNFSLPDDVTEVLCWVAPMTVFRDNQ